jgi:hypothetical protein
MSITEGERIKHPKGEQWLIRNLPGQGLNTCCVVLKASSPMIKYFSGSSFCISNASKRLESLKGNYVIHAATVVT